MIFMNAYLMESSLDSATKQKLVYVAGYVTRRDEEMTEEESLACTTFYYDSFGDFTKELDNDGINVPSDSACQFIFFSYILFQTIKDNVCGVSLANILYYVSEFYDFNMEKRHCKIFSNTLLNYHCKDQTPLLDKEPCQKVLKLSS